MLPAVGIKGAWKRPVRRGKLTARTQAEEATTATTDATATAYGGVDFAIGADRQRRQGKEAACGVSREKWHEKSGARSASCGPKDVTTSVGRRRHCLQYLGL